MNASGGEVEVGDLNVLRPTYFELVAADRLMPSLKTAAFYCTAVLAQRQPSLHRVLDNFHEIYAIMSLIFEQRSLSMKDASFAESFFGLQRQLTTSTLPDESTKSSGQLMPLDTSAFQSPTKAPALLPDRSRILSLIFLVGVPYVKARLEQRYSALPRPAGSSTTEIQGRSVLDGVSEDEDRGQTREHVEERGGSPSTSFAARAASGVTSYPEVLRVYARLLWGALKRAGFAGDKIMRWLYPLIHIGWEGSQFIYACLYLVGGRFFSAPLHALGLEVIRATPETLEFLSKQVAQRRQLVLARAAVKKAAKPVSASENEGGGGRGAAARCLLSQRPHPEQHCRGRSYIQGVGMVVWYGGGENEPLPGVTAATSASDPPSPPAGKAATRRCSSVSVVPKPSH
eukprot:CAMPEP_0196594130 /NCGR_PEP_ID=MMETSP1081-20130531/77435_1 /TAXON_ID=36882 /ORGANISM="Pyramimonas amylifera, Strain CCMP720" /LENGTH=399 /DNA_ID=CAMNT_0041918301 /DNA_START=176 /DNA_END=1374 /DNA_ORIENTATION=+